MAKYDLGYDLNEAMKRQDLSQDDLNALRQPPIDGMPATITDKQLALFLDACGSVSSARKTIKTYYDIRKNTPEFFSERDPLSDKIQQCFKCQVYFHLPPTPQGYPIIYHRLSDPKASNYHFAHAIKTFFMTIEACLHKLGPRPGIIFLFDMRGTGLSHLTRVRIGTIKKYFQYLQEALPAKLCQIHVLNVVPFFDKIMAMIKPFMRAEIFKVMYTYPPGMNYDDFHRDWIPKECLPSDLGGTLPSIEQLHNEFTKKELINLREYFQAEEEQRTPISCKKIETPRISDAFSSLEID